MLPNLQPTRKIPWRFVFEPRIGVYIAMILLPSSLRTTLFVLVPQDETSRWAISSRWTIRNFVRKPHRNEWSAHRRRNRTNAVDIYDRNGDVHVRVSLSETQALGDLWPIRGRTKRGQKYVGFFCPALTSPGKRRIQKAAVDSTEYLLDRPGPSEKTPGPRS